MGGFPEFEALFFHQLLVHLDAEARRLFTSAQQSFTNLQRGTRGHLLPPIDDIEAYWTPGEKAQASAMLNSLCLSIHKVQFP